MGGLPCFLSPGHDAVHQTGDEQGAGQVPAVAHGDEHHVVGVLQVPLSAAAGGVEHEANLWDSTGPGRWREAALTHTTRVLHAHYTHITCILHITRVSSNHFYLQNHVKGWLRRDWGVG